MVLSKDGRICEEKPQARFLAVTDDGSLSPLPHGAGALAAQLTASVKFSTIGQLKDATLAADCLHETPPLVLAVVGLSNGVRIGDT
jgi:hypothetical protein